MCLYPRIIQNPRYKANKKNKGNIPRCDFREQRYITIDCGKCIECRKKIAREWQIRLCEEIKNYEGKMLFVTLTFAEGQYQLLRRAYGLHDEEQIVKKAVRLFLERVRKKTKKSMKHWLITEHGKNGTERIHLHGILWSNFTQEEIAELWKYGFVYVGQYVNEKSAGYITKYITKEDDRGYKGIVLCSAGIGKCYTQKEVNRQKHQFRGAETIDTYRGTNGHILALPRYYRNLLFTDKQKAYLWHERTRSGEKFVRGIKVDISEKGVEEYRKLLKEKQLESEQLGYKRADFEERGYFEQFCKILNISNKKMKISRLQRK